MLADLYPKEMVLVANTSQGIARYRGEPRAVQRRERMGWASQTAGMASDRQGRNEDQQPERLTLVVTSDSTLGTIEMLVQIVGNNVKRARTML